jgi:hypothetical protein
MFGYHPSVVDLAIHFGEDGPEQKRADPFEIGSITLGQLPVRLSDFLLTLDELVKGRS